MKKVAAAGASVALTLAFAVFTGSALAGGGHDNDGSHGSGGQARQESSREGVKPSSTTRHDTHARADSNQTKQYGNGKTAGRVAQENGAPPETVLHGPGNSQPHKVASCRGHEVDVHALKAHGGAGCEAGERVSRAPKQVAHERKERKPVHATKTASKQERHEQETEEAHTTAQVAGAQECVRTVTVAVPAGVEHFVGPKGSGRYVIIHPSPSSAHYANKHPDEIVYEARTVTVRVDCSAPASQVREEAEKKAAAVVATAATTTTTAAVASTRTVTNTQTVTTTVPETQTATTTAAGGVAGVQTTTTAPAQPTGAVLGAQATLPTKPKPGGLLGTVGGATLPFTGLPLWAVVLAALGVGGLGLAVRRGLREPF